MTRHDADALTQTFHSAPGLHPPIVSVSGRDPDPEYGDIVTDASNAVQPGPKILSPQGQLIWFSPVSGGRFACDVEVQRYQSQSVLTYWQGYGGVLPTGRDVILNHRYQTIAVVQAATGYVTDTHEFTINAAGDGTDQRVPDHPCQPDLSGWSPPGTAGRLDRSGERDRDRPGAVAVAGVRARPTDRQLCGQAGQGPLRLLSFELDPAAPERQPPRVRPSHLDRVRDQSADRRHSVGNWAGSTRASSSGPAPTSSGSTTHGCTPTAR